MPVYDSSGETIVYYTQPTVGFLPGIFKSFGDAPGGFSEELKEITYSFGVEYSFNNNFKLRTGYFIENELKGSRNHLTLGFGLITNPNLKFDLSYLISMSEIISPLENTLRLSIGYDLF